MDKKNTNRVIKTLFTERSIKERAEYPYRSQEYLIKLNKLKEP